MFPSLPVFRRERFSRSSSKRSAAARQLIPRITHLETIPRSANAHKLCTRPRRSPCRPLSRRLSFSLSLSSSTSTYLLPYLHRDFSSLRSGSRPRVPTKWAAPLARGTQLKVSHTGVRTEPCRAATTGIDPPIRVSFRSQIPRSSSPRPSKLIRGRRSSPITPLFVLTNRRHSLAFQTKVDPG